MPLFYIGKNKIIQINIWWEIVAVLNPKREAKISRI